MNRYSWARVGLSLTLSGMALGLCQTTSARRYQPSSWRAKADRQGIPCKSLGFRPSGVSGRMVMARAGFFLSGARQPLFSACIAVADVEPEHAIIGEHTFSLGKDGNQAVDELGQGGLEPDLFGDVVIPEPPVGR